MPVASHRFEHCQHGVRVRLARHDHCVPLWLLRPQRRPVDVPGQRDRAAKPCAKAGCGSSRSPPQLSEHRDVSRVVVGCCRSEAVRCFVVDRHHPAGDTVELVDVSKGRGMHAVLPVPHPRQPERRRDQAGSQGKPRGEPLDHVQIHRPTARRGRLEERGERLSLARAQSRSRQRLPSAGVGVLSSRHPAIVATRCGKRHRPALPAADSAAMPDQISVCSEISRASSTSMPRYLTVDSSLEWPEQQLHGAQVLGAPVDQRRLRPAHRVRPVVGAVQAQLVHPVPKNPGVLSGSQMR